jgi:Tfp pilus assembly protein PilF
LPVLAKKLSCWPTKVARSANNHEIRRATRRGFMKKLIFVWISVLFPLSLCSFSCQTASRRPSDRDLDKPAEIELSATSAFEEGMEFLSQGHDDEAKERFSKAVELKPNHAEAYFYWGLALEEPGSYEEAIEKFKKAVKLRPDYAEAYFEWGQSLYKLGRSDEGREKVVKAMQLKTRH